MKLALAKSLFSALVSGVILFSFAGQAGAQQAPPPPPGFVQPMPMQFPPALDTTGRLKLFLQAGYGVGFDSVDIGQTTNGDTVRLSGGGGAAIGIGMGYGLSRDFDLDFDLGIQASTMSPNVANADGTFTRSFLLATFKRKFPTSESGQFKFGIGLGLYSGGELDVDTTGVINGSHTIVKYDPALGFHVTGEFERFFLPNMSLHAGMKLYFVQYKADSATDNGVAVPVDNLTGKVKDFNGSGLDFLVGVSTYF